ncbi:MAG: hypothetical protein R2874_09235 [Desulfobacterales bacterium]
MRTQEKYNLAEMLKEIDDDMHEQKKDLRQEKNIPQETITELMLANLSKKKIAAPTDGNDWLPDL